MIIVADWTRDVRPLGAAAHRANGCGMATSLPPQGERPPGLDLNLASEEELERLPGIGVAYAAAIAAARDADGPYHSPLDLVEREIIPPHVFHRIHDHVQVRRAPAGWAQPLRALLDAPRGLVLRRAAAGATPRWLRSREGRRAFAIGGALLVAAVPILLVVAALGGDDRAVEPNAAATVSSTPEGTPNAPGSATPASSPAALVLTAPTAVALADSAVRYIGNTGGSGVALRDVCDDGTRLGGAWIDGTEVIVEERGTGACFTWSRVRSESTVSWVRNAYLVDEQSSLPIVTGTSAGLPDPGVSWAQRFCIQYRLAGSHYQVCRTFPTLERSQWTPQDLGSYGHISIQRLDFFADCYINRPKIGRPLDRCAFAQLGP